MSLPMRHAQAGTVSAAVSRTIAKAGIGAAPAELWAASMGEAPARHTPIAKASRAHVSKIETAAAKHRDDVTDVANVQPFSLL
ncbi:MAG: hypothetical protein ACTHKH_11480 [Trinickia sp.]